MTLNGVRGAFVLHPLPDWAGHGCECERLLIKAARVLVVVENIPLINPDRECKRHFGWC